MPVKVGLCGFTIGAAAYFETFGIVEVHDNHRVTGFVEKPKEGAKTMPGRPDMVLASMGNYVFKSKVMIDVLEHNALRDAAHDFGKEIVPEMYPQMNVYAYDFATNKVPGETERSRGYWRDVGTVDAYFEASMDLVEVDPTFNLYNNRWPILSANYQLPPAKFVFADRETHRIGLATDSLVADGAIISGGTLNRSILSPRVKINSFSHVDECILMDGVDVGRHARLRRTIVDKGVRIPPNAVIGYDMELDRKRFTVTESGIVVVPKGLTIAETERESE